MRLLHRPDPRCVALLLLPVLLAAGALHAPSGPTSHGVDLAMPDVPRALPATAIAALPPAGRHAHGDADGHPPAAISARHVLRADRADPDRRGRSVAERGAAALATLTYDWRALGYTLRFRAYDGSGLGSANRRTRTITVYVRPRQSDLSLRVSLAHELGHALDFEHGTQERRDAYRSIRGLSPSSSWFPCDRCDDYASPAGDFAEVFAFWLVGPGDFRSRLAGPPSAHQLRELEPLFALPQPAAPAPAAAASPTPAPATDEEPERRLPELLVGQPTPSPGR